MRHFGFYSLALVCGLGLSACAPPASLEESSQADNTVRHRRYLATGDSVPFGFNPLVTDQSQPENFVGYPEALAMTLQNDVANASCPGETSGSLISIAAADNGCQAFRSINPLHVDYQGSQLSFALAYLHSEPDTQLVTITIGANDLFILLRSCSNSLPCVIGKLPILLGQLQAHLTTIYTQLRGTGYHGQLIAVTYYAVNYSDPAQVQLIGAIDSTVAAVTIGFQGRVADGFNAFLAAAAPFGGDSCAAGLLIRLTATTCDIHPSPTGRDLLAKAVQQVLAPPGQ